MMFMVKGRSRAFKGGRVGVNGQEVEMVFLMTVSPVLNKVRAKNYKARAKNWVNGLF